MTDNLKKFFEEASSNNAFLEKLAKLNQEKPDPAENKSGLLSLAREFGMELTKADLDGVTESDKSQLFEEADEAELENVAGGSYDGDRWRNRSVCQCFMGGFGSEDNYQKTCVCVAAGVGELTELGKKEAKTYRKWGRIRTCGLDDAPVAMWCAVVGSGY